MNVQTDYAEYEHTFIVNGYSGSIVSHISFENRLEHNASRRHLGLDKSGQQAPYSSEGHLLAVA